MVNNKQIALVIIGVIILSIGVLNYVDAQQNLVQESVNKQMGFSTLPAGYSQNADQTFLFSILIAIGFFIGASAIGNGNSDPKKIKRIVV